MELVYTGWDTTQMGLKGLVHRDFKNELFDMQISAARNKAQSDFIVITAWNEWGEGAIMDLARGNLLIYYELAFSLLQQAHYRDFLLLGCCLIILELKTIPSLLIQNLSIGLNLCLNFGLNTFMLRYPTNSILNEAVTELKLIYIVYFLGTLLVSIIYYIQIFDQSVGLIGFLATISASSITFLLANNFQQFYIGQGRMNYAHVRYIAAPKIWHY